MTYRFVIIVLSLIVGAKAFAQEYIDSRFGNDATEAKTVVTVDGVQLFIWNEETKEMAVKGNDCLRLLPPGYSIVTPEYSRADFEGGSYSGDVLVPSHAEYNGTTYTVTRIAFGAFIKCPNLNSVTLPETINSFGAEAFYGCENLTHVELPRNLDYINLNIFADCPSLKKIDLKNTRLVYPMDKQRYNYFYIGGDFHFSEITHDSTLPSKFCYFPELEKLYLRTDDPYRTDDPEPDDSFLPGQLENVEIIVPVGSLDTYRSRAPWSWFTHITESDIHLSGISDVRKSGTPFSLKGNTLIASGKPLEVYTVVGVLAARMQPGETIRLSPGIYIATDGTSASKIAIR